MNRSIKTYIISWVILVAAFNAIVFVAPGWSGTDKYTGSFWAGYIFTMIAMAAHLLITLWAFKDADGSSRKLFYNIPIIYLGYSAMIVSIIVGALCMLNSRMPVWIAIVVSIVLVVFYSGAILRTRIAVNAIESIDINIEKQTSFMKTLRSEAESLNSSAPREFKHSCNKVYEAIRYADPVSSGGTEGIENDIAEHYAEFEKAVLEKDGTRVEEEARVLIEAINKRNALCRRGK